MKKKRKLVTRKPAARKPAPRKTARKKVKTRTDTKTISRTSPRKVVKKVERETAHGALKLVDEAAALLRGGIRTGASTVENSRQNIKKDARTAVSKASSSLEKLISGSASLLDKAIQRL